MKRVVGVVCLLVVFLTADVASARVFNRRTTRRGRTHSSERTSASQSAPIDKAPVYEVEHRLLKAINAVRSKYGLKALIMDVKLHRTARQHCGWMASNRSMVHSSFPCAENIAQGYASVESVMNGWMSSSGHRANILNPQYTKVGLSGYSSPNGHPYWCQQFK
jgi:uncharacterized protein YkwD